MISHSIEYCENTDCYYQAIIDFNLPIMLKSQANDRFDIIVAEPFKWLTMKGDQSILSQVNGPSQVLQASALEVLKTLLPQIDLPKDQPFCGGAVGLISYDAMSQNDDGSPEYLCPDLIIGLYDWAMVIDHHNKTAILYSCKLDKSTSQLWPKLIKRFGAINPKPSESFSIRDIQTNLPYEEYKKRFEAVKRYIAAGDCYQVNLAQRFSMDFTGSSFAAFQALKPTGAKFSAYIKGANFEVLSFSPERFLQLNYPIIKTKPIKGTRPRSSHPSEDNRLAQELLNSPKDRAENVMIVDLLRNDLSKVSEPFSVRVEELCVVESNPAVHHLVSTISAKIKPGLSGIDVLQACFPGGSITGAPKRRAMEIIAELEPNHRGPYCGSIFYIGWDGAMDSNIAIRTLLRENDKLYCWAGGGIVYDSKLDAEYQETQDKVRLILDLLTLGFQNGAS